MVIFEGKGVSFLDEIEKKQPEYFCSYSSRLTNFLKAYGLSYEKREVNEITGAPFCVFKRTPKLIAIVSYWSNDGRGKFADFDENGYPKEDKAGDP